MIRRLMALATALLATGVAAAQPDVGALAPEWSLAGSDGQTHSLADLRGRHVVVAFFPKAFTGG